MNLLKAGFGFISITLFFASVGLAEQSWTGHLIVKYRHPPMALGGNKTAFDRKGKIHRISVRSAVRTETKGSTVLESLSTYANECEAFQGSNIEYCEPDIWIETEALSNDPSLNQMPALNQIRASQAWDYTVGSSDAVVAVMDTGIDLTHPDLAANAWSHPGEVVDGLDNDGNGYIDDVAGYDFFNKDNSAMDDNGHGTHVAGTIGAVGNNGVGVSGVAWKTSLLPIKFLGSGGGGPLSNALVALAYLVDLKERYGLRIIVNASWGGTFYSAALENAIQELGAAGILFVSAAGNSNSDNDLTIHSPSGLNADNIIAVAAVDTKGLRASFSNYGYGSVDLAAPGTDILSTLRGGGYGTLSGTSMATPHVSGVAALVWSLNPEFSHLQVKDQILNTVSPANLPIGTAGIVDAYAALTGDVSEGPAADLAEVKITEIRDGGSGALDQLSPGKPFSLRLKSDAGSSESVLLGASIYGSPCPFQLASVPLLNSRKVRGRVPRRLVRGSVEFTVTNSAGGIDSRTARIRGKDKAKLKNKKALKSQKARILGEELSSVCAKLAASLH